MSVTPIYLVMDAGIPVTAWRNDAESRRNRRAVKIRQLVDVRVCRGAQYLRRHAYHHF
jgi:hypothetical protein